MLHLARFLGGLLAIAPALTGIAQASGTVALDPHVTAVYGPNTWIQTVGWNFDTQAQITVVALGAYWDGQAGFSAQVGLWTYDANQSLLASTTVTTADTFIDGFYFRYIDPVTLSASRGYTIGAAEDVNAIGGILSMDSRIG